MNDLKDPCETVNCAEYKQIAGPYHGEWSRCSVSSAFRPIIYFYRGTTQLKRKSGAFPIAVGSLHHCLLWVNIFFTELDFLINWPHLIG